MSYKKIRPSFAQKFYQAFKLFFVWAGKADEIDGYFRIEKFSKLLRPMHFSQKGASVEEKRKFFKEELMSVEFETHAYCNRTCYFCPNSFLDRRNKTQLMSEKVFFNILNELAAIDFSGQIKMQRYNEPLSNEIIFERVAQTRKALPKANISFHSNGDYVTYEKLERLEKAGLDEIFVSLYPDYEKHKDTIKQEGYRICNEFLKKVKVEAQAQEVPGHELGRYFFKVGALAVTVFAFNLQDCGNDRGGTLKDLSINVRRSPCMSPFSRLYVDWTGEVFPCCNLRTDYPGHKEYMLGNVNNTPLMDIFYSKTSNFMRRHLAGVSDKTGVCRTCKFDLMCSNKAAENVLDKRLKAMGVAPC